MLSLLWGVGSSWGHCQCHTANESLPVGAGGAPGACDAQDGTTRRNHARTLSAGGAEVENAALGPQA